MAEINPQQLLEERFGLTTFRPGQKAVMSALWRKRAALAVFPTGGGKSLCYQLPALAFEGVTVVVSPLIALMKDQIDFLQSRGIAAARLDSSLGAQEGRRVMDNVASGKIQLLYVAPERFNNERFLAAMSRIKIALFAVDEAHCISEWGHNFRPDYLKLADTARDLGVERVLALTATATPSVVQDICTAFGIPQECAIVTGFYRHNLNLSMTPARADERDALLLKRLQTRKPGPGIVYVTLQKTAERVAAQLETGGVPARAYHAGMESEERTAVQEWWMASDRAVVVATIAFGMGIDKADVRYVYHYNLPKGLESYSQEIGRAGRDGERSTVELFACPEDVPTLENFAFGDTPTDAALRSLLTELLTVPADTEEENSAELHVSQYDLSNRHDLRPLVLKTVLTYLELMGVLKQGTPFYAGYEMRPLRPVPEILGCFSGEPMRLIESIFAQAKRGRIWYGMNPSTVAETLGQDRKRIVRAVEVLEERGLVELRASDIRQRYTRLQPEAEIEALVAALMERFLHREGQEIARIGQVLELVEHDGCQTNALVGYFGENRPEPCGHCTFCVTGKPQRLPAPDANPPLPAAWDADAFAQLRAAHPDALSETRQSARFLCGLSSPALTRARLARHPLFGSLETRRFQEVLDMLTPPSYAEQERAEEPASFN
ncbi:MAG: ATP-dependent helicase, RecQ family [Chthonomonadaceae bacterium]|nr:ATP-dependent helicase, RecQ family [Chthonomonadaceae bacterium]